MSAVHLNENNFKQIAVDSSKPVLIDFWAGWCGPCRMQSPIIEQLADEVAGIATIAKLDVDENPGLASQFSVMSIPTLILMRAGEIIWRRSGVTPKEALLEIIKSTVGQFNG